MEDKEKIKALELRIVELENQMKVFQPVKREFTEQEIDTYIDVSKALVLASQQPHPCECHGGECAFCVIPAKSTVVNLLRVRSLGR